MRLSQLLGRSIRETPRDAMTISHIYLLRGGYARPVSTGIYSLLPLGIRITKKIEQIIREEMDRVDGQEVLMPVALPAELWEESGRYETVGSELLRFQDRNEKQMVLAMTHEEAVVHMVRGEVNSYKQLPFMVYQIQTKYRDEARPRAGLLRVREFRMKDGYSFHVNAEDLDAYYERVHGAYSRIFRRLGMKEVVSIQSDTGMMGGKIAHEFMAVGEAGEDTIFVTEYGSYRANREVATSAVEFIQEEPLPLDKVSTPEMKTIDGLATFLGIETSQTGKAVFYTDSEGKLYFVVIRGDFEVNETKLANHLQVSELNFAEDSQIEAIGAVPGYASPMNVDLDRVRVVFDHSARKSSNLVVGANEKDFHFKNFNFDRDMGELAGKVDVPDIANAREGDPDPLDGIPLIMKRGIEVGNIFQLGTKYSDIMNCSFLDRNGKSQPMTMGCYGIGVERSMAAAIEQNHDKYGPVWPFSIAPFEVHLCGLNINKEGVGEAAEKLYAGLKEAGVDVLYDDRNEKAGSAFNDADLIGVPFRLIVSPKNLADNQVEFKTRDGKLKEMWGLDEAIEKIVTIVNEARAEARDA
ncbi:MAG: proline--tRNA ligase [Deltaproteobacteria bacterium]|nr:proline--tRNA ligase [Deltaproteobacteria bacterium]